MKCASPFIWRSGRTSTPRPVQVEPERGDAAVLRDRRVVAREQQPEARVRAPARPHLLAVHAPLVAVALARVESPARSEPAPGLREQLAPDLLAGRDLRQPARTGSAGRGRSASGRRARGRRGTGRDRGRRTRRARGARRRPAPASRRGRRTPAATTAPRAPSPRAPARYARPGVEIVGARAEHRRVRVGAPGRGRAVSSARTHARKSSTAHLVRAAAATSAPSRSRCAAACRAAPVAPAA